MKIFIPLLLAGLSLCLAPLVRAENSSVIEGVTDAQWLKFMENHAFKMEGLKAKMPILAEELRLTASDQQEVKNLFSDHSDEALLSRVATSPGIRAGRQDVDLNASQSKAKQSNYNAMEDNADDAPAETLNQVKMVRDRLGSRDSDFRFWFYEEEMIDQAEDQAYHKDHDYSAGEATAGLLMKLEQTQEFKDFKARKLALIHSDQKVAAYFANWKRLISRRVLLQRQTRRHAL